MLEVGVHVVGLERLEPLLLRLLRPLLLLLLAVQHALLRQLGEPRQVLAPPLAAPHEELVVLLELRAPPSACGTRKVGRGRWGGREAERTGERKTCTN